MCTWLIDTTLFNVVGSTKATSVRNWLDANDASVFPATSFVEIAAAIAKTPAAQVARREAMQA